MLYGSMDLSEEQWEALLHSDKGLFKRARKAPGNVIGPTVTKSGNVQGEQLAMEMAAFEDVATDDQRVLLLQLRRNNPLAAVEYALTISGSIEVWKEDMVQIRQLIEYLKDEEGVLEAEEKEIEDESGRVFNASRALEALRRQMPEKFANVQMDTAEFETIIQRIRAVLAQVKEEEEYLVKYLAAKRLELPFLFR